MRYTDEAWFAIGEPGATVTISATLANRLRAWVIRGISNEFDDDCRTRQPGLRGRDVVGRLRAERLAAMLRDHDAIVAALKPHHIGSADDEHVRWARHFVTHYAAEVPA